MAETPTWMWTRPDPVLDGLPDLFARVCALEEATARYRAHAARVAEAIGDVLVHAPALTPLERAAALTLRRALHYGVPAHGGVCARLAEIAPPPLDAELVRIATEAAALGTLESALDDAVRAEAARAVRTPRCRPPRDEAERSWTAGGRFRRRPPAPHDSSRSQGSGEDDR